MSEIGSVRLLNVATSPHWRGGGSLTRMQLLWLVALGGLLLALLRPPRRPASTPSAGTHCA